MNEHDDFAFWVVLVLGFVIALLVLLSKMEVVG